MSACPACGRPVATARPTCLYCGARLPKEAVAAATVAAQEAAKTEARKAALVAGTHARPEPATGSPRQLLVVDLTGVDTAAIAEGLGLPAFEAGLRGRAGGLHLHRAGSEDEVAAEALRLRQAGLRVLTLPESEARIAPVVATGGGPGEGGLDLQTSRGPLSVTGRDILLVVEGPIQREYQAREVERKKPRVATLEAGYRFHLHRRSDLHPVELDPSSFSFGARGAVAGSSLLEMKAWLAALGAIPVDEAFRRQPVALAPAPEEDHAVAGLRRAGSGLGRPAGAVPVLDNVAQFRFWSGWRAAAFRRLQGVVLPSSRP